MLRHRRLVISLIVAVLLLGAYAAAGFLAVPWFARRAAIDFARTHYGRTLTLGDIRFNPFTLVLDVRGASLPDADGEKLLAFDRLFVDVQWSSLWRLGPYFRAIRLEQPYVRVVVGRAGALNLADLGKGFPPSPPAKQPPKPLRLFIDRLAVIAGGAVFEDRTRASPFHADFRPIDFELRNFSTRAGAADAYTLHAASPDGERLEWSGTLQLEPLASRGVFEIADLKARTVWNYLRETLPFEVDSGVIHVSGDYDLATGGGPTSLKLDARNTTITHLGIRPKDAQPPPAALAQLPLLRGIAQSPHYVDVGHITVTDTRLDLARHSVAVGKAALSAGDVKVWMSEQGRINLLELVSGGNAAAAVPSPGSVTPAGAAPAPTAPRSGAAQWTVAAPDIAIEHFKVELVDLQVKPALTLLLDPLNVHVAGFNTSPDDVLDIRFDSGVNAAGKIEARAQLTPRTGAADAHLEAANLDLTVLQPLIAQYTSMTLLSGSLGGRFDLKRGADSALSAAGNAWVHDVHTVDNALKLDFVKWKVLRIADISYASAPMKPMVPAKLAIGSVTALEPYVRMVVAPDRTLNIKEVMTAPGAATNPPAAASAPAAKRAADRDKKVAATAPPAAPAAPLTPFPVSVGTITFVNGSANYADLWIKPSFSVGIQSLAGTVRGLSSDPRSHARVDLNGKVDRYAPVHIGGEVNLLSTALYTDVTLSMKDLDMTVVNPYSGRFAGYKIDKGKLSVDVSYHIDQRRLDAKQHFVVDQLELGERVESPDAVHLPLKIAVALLKDRNGVIDLDLPMAGSLDDPSFRIGPIIWKMVVNLVVKVATAPFALIGHLFGGGEHPNLIDFAPASAELDPPAREQLAAISKAMQERPQLKLDVPMVYSAQIDGPALAAAQLRTALLARAAASRAGKRHPDTAGEMALADPARHFGLLLDEYRAQLGKDAALPPSAAAVLAAKRGETVAYDPAVAELEAVLLASFPIPDSALQGLGKARAQAIQDALLSDGHVEPGRVFIVNAPPGTQTGDQVTVALAVK